mgnify:CR=1 FL=1
MAAKVSELLSVTHLCGHSRSIPVPEGVLPSQIEGINKLLRCPSCARTTPEGTGTGIREGTRKLPNARVITSVALHDAALWRAFRAETTRRGETASAVLSRMVKEYLVEAGVIEDGEK